MATSDFKVKKGLQVGPGDLTINVDNDTAAFANGYSITIGSATVLTDADNVSSLSNDANYITLTSLSATGDLTYNNATGEISFTQRTDQQVRNLFSGTGDITYESTNGQISFNNSTGYITLTDLSGGTGISYNNTTGEISIAQNIASDQDVTFNTITATDKVLTDTITAVGAGTDVTIDDNLIVSGNLTVNGTTTTLNSTTLTVDDLNIVVASGAADAAAADGAGLTIEGANATLTYAATGDKFVMNKSLDTDIIGTVSDISNHDTDALSEGSTNLYYTDTRSRASISVTDAGGDGSLAYDNVTGVITYTGPSAAEVRAHFSAGTGVTITNGEVAIGQSVGTTDDVTFNSINANLTGNVTGTVSDISNHDTDDLSEGTTNLYYTQARFDTAFGNKTTNDLAEGTGVSPNLYFTETRARNTISASGDLSYDSATGVVSFTERTDAEVRGLLSAAGDLSYNSTTGEFSVTLPDDLGDLTNNAGFIKLTDINATGDLSYNNSTGVFSFTERTDAEVRGLVSAGGDLSYNSTTGVFSVTTYKDADADARIAAATLDNLSDVNYTTTPADGQILVWDNANQYWEPVSPFGANDFDTRFALKTTDDLTEGSTNLYYTDAKARAAISVAGDLAYNSSTGVISYSTPTNLSDFTNDTNFITLASLSATGDLAYNNSTGVISFTERTDAEVRGLVSATGDISYNNSTGVISFTERTDAEVRGLVSATGDISYNNSTGVFSFNNNSGFLTSYTETDTLDTVTGRGATTANDIQVGGLTVTGDLTVSGTTTTINTATLDVADNQITLNSDVTAAPSENAGIVIERGTSTNVDLRWNETDDKWQFTNDGTTYYNIPEATSDLSNDSNFISLTDISATGDISYNNSTGVISFNNTTGYITRTGISASGDISYNNTTGEITFNNTSGFITAGELTETDTLDTVTTRGSITTNSAEFGALTVGGTSVALVGANISTFTNNSNFIDLTDLSAVGDITYDNTTGQFSFNNSSGYITAEADTLATVTARGDTTNTAVTFGSTVTVNNEIYSNGTVLQTEAGVNKTNLAMFNGYIQLNQINQLYSDGDLWLANAQQNSSGNDTKVISTANALGTDVGGNSLQIKAGTSTGSAVSGSISFHTGTAGPATSAATNTSQERLTIRGTDGRVMINNAYALPESDGTANQAIITDGSGSLSFGSVLTDVVEDTSPQLGGNLDADGNDITGIHRLEIGDENISSTPRLQVEHNATNSTVDVVPAGAGIRTILGGSTTSNIEDSSGNIRFSVAAGGDVTINDTYILPSDDGTVGQYIGTDGSGNLSFSTPPKGIELTDLSAGGDISYNNTTGEFSFTERTNTEIRELFNAVGSIQYDSSTGTFAFVERTDTEVRGLVSGTGDISYNSTTGEFSFNNSTGYITGADINETDTLQSVTNRGNTTSNSITVNDMTVNGNLTVSGTTTYVNSTQLNIGDNIITLNADFQSGNATENAGIEVERGADANVLIRWNETADRWEYTNDGTNYSYFPLLTSDLTNDSNFVALGDISGTGDIDFNQSTGVISFNNNSGFLTAETDTLDSVTTRGNTTSNALIVNSSLTIQNEIYTQGVALKYQNLADQAQMELGSTYFKFENIDDFFVESDLVLHNTATDSTGAAHRAIKTAAGAGTNISGSNIDIEAGTSTGNAQAGSITFKTGTTGATSNNISNVVAERFKISGADGSITINQAYTLPTADGANGQFLGTDGAGALTFKQISYSDLSGSPAIAQVGLTGDYADLINVPTNVSTFVNDAGYYSDGSQMIGDLKGSVFGDDSVVLVDSVNSRLETHYLNRVGATNGQALVWDDSNLRWQPGTVDGDSINLVLEQVGDIDTSGKQPGDNLQWNGTQWVPVGAAESSGITVAAAEELAFAAALIMG